MALVFYNNALLVKNGSLATGVDCCCGKQVVCGCCVRLRTCKDSRPNAQVSAATEQACLADRQWVVTASITYFSTSPPSVVGLDGFTITTFQGGPEGLDFVIRACSVNYLTTLQDAQTAVTAVEQWHTDNYSDGQLDYVYLRATKVWLACGDTIPRPPTYASNESWTDLTGATVSSCNTYINPLP